MFVALATVMEAMMAPDAIEDDLSRRFRIDPPPTLLARKSSKEAYRFFAHAEQSSDGWPFTGHATAGGFCIPCSVVGAVFLELIVGTACYAAATTAYFCSAILLPKALIDQGAAVTFSLGLSTLLFMMTIPGKLFTGFIMEIIGRRWTITYCFAGAIPGLALMALAHRTGDYATVAMSAGAIITGLTVLSSFTAVRVYLSEQFPTALRGRGHFFGEATGRIFSGVLVPFLLEPYTELATIFLGTIAVVVAIGACVPLLFGKETVGQLEIVTDAALEPGKA